MQTRKVFYWPLEISNSWNRAERQEAIGPVIEGRDFSFNREHWAGGGVLSKTSGPGAVTVILQLWQSPGPQAVTPVTRADGAEVGRCTTTAAVLPTSTVPQG